MTWINEELQRRFAEIAELMDLLGEDRYRVRAYERAADAIAAAGVDLSTLERDKLTNVKGVGDSTATKIAQYLDEGRIDLLEELRAKVPDGVRELTRVPGLGPKTAMMIHRELGVESVDALAAAIDAQQLRDLPGLGAKTEENLREGIRRLGTGDDDRTPAADVLPIAEALCDELRALPQAERVAYAGSLRRMRETIGDVDVLVASTDPAPVHEAFRSSSLVQRVLLSGERKTSVLTVRDLQADLRVVEPDAWGAAMVYFTGSKAHNIRIRERAVRRDLTLNEYGLFRRDPDTGAAGNMVASRDEADVYAALDLPWVAPPLREDNGEVEAADAGQLPAVVTEADLRGDLHGHSDWSGDGKEPLADIVAAAARRGWDYWAVTDHAAGLPMNGIDAADFARRRQAIAELRGTAGLAVLDAVELNIADDGSVDFDADVLAEFDWCVAAIHTQLQRSQAEQTERILAAVANPFVNAIGHPTGRKLGKRPGYEIDLDAILQACAETGTALEINGSPRRFDLSDRLARRAADAGVWLTIATDAHTVADLEHARWGTTYAQRAWLTPAQVLNCQPLEAVRRFVVDKRERLG